MALANKMARIAWALLAKGDTYHAMPVLAAAAYEESVDGRDEVLRLVCSRTAGVMTTLMREAGRDRRSGKTR